MKQHNYRIKEARERGGLTQAELAEKLGVSQSTFCGYENGSHDPRSKKLSIIAQECNTRLDYILRLSEDPEPFKEIKNSPNPEGSGEQISMDESNRLFDALVSAGLIRDNIGFSDDDRAFLNHIFGLLDIWCRSKGQ